MRKFKFVITLIVMVLVITGCASGGKEKPRKDNWNDFQTDKKVVIGFDNTFVPMGFQDKSGKDVGFDIDLANAVFERYGIKAQWQAINWDLKETELKNGNIDLIWNGYSKTDERESIVQFTKQYMVNEQVIVVKKSKNIKAISDLKDKVLGAQNGSSGYDTFNSSPEVLKNIVKNNDATQYESFNEALIDLENDRIDALLIDKVYANYYLKQQNKLDDFNILNAGFESEAFAVGARKADITLVNKINEAFHELYREGTFQKIANKWCGEDVATEEVKSK